jgi:hypothetical protein
MCRVAHQLSRRRLYLGLPGALGECRLRVPNTSKQRMEAFALCGVMIRDRFPTQLGASLVRIPPLPSRHGLIMPVGLSGKRHAQASHARYRDLSRKRGLLPEIGGNDSRMFGGIANHLGVQNNLKVFASPISRSAAKRSRQDLRVGDKLPRRLRSGIVNAGHDSPI